MLSLDQIRAPRRNRRLTVIGVASIVLGIVFAAAGTVRARWEPVSHFLNPQGRQSSASANLLSEHEVEALDSMSPQKQAELLLERSINHYRGANEQIAARVDRWRGLITLNIRLNNLFMTALNSDDLHVRTAAIEVNLAARNVEKTSAMLDRLEPDARFGEQGARVNALLLDFAEDPALDAETHSWVFQALRDITGQTLPHDATAWRKWYGRANAK